MYILRKVRAARLFLIIIPVLILSTFSSLLGYKGTAYAASIASTYSSPPIRSTSAIHAVSHSASKHMNSQPSDAFGGGCAKNAFISSCISIDSYDVITPDAYINKAGCGIAVYLYEDNAYVSAYFYNSCYVAGTHFYGPPVDNDAGNTYQTYASVSSNNVGQWSPVQYT